MKSITTLLLTSFIFVMSSHAEQGNLEMANTKPNNQTTNEAIEPTYIGTATMEQNGDIAMQLFASTEDGNTSGQAFFKYKPGTKEYEALLKHIDGLKIGESKGVPPWNQ